MGLLSFLLLLLSAPWVPGAVQAASPYPTFTKNDTHFEHLALHPNTTLGRVYVGARNRLFQLSADLQLEEEDHTGPVKDSRDCLPPITEQNCPQARQTNNHNKLLLVDPYRQELISCGSVNQGICQKRSLDSVGTVLFSTERPVDTQYVAANDPNVTTVGLVVQSRGRQPVLFVGRGFTSSHPPISTRNLASEPIFSYEETAKLAVAGRLSEYDHHFVTSFSHRAHVYFLFYRRDLKSQSREYRTYVSRVCLDDTSYYSYVEVPLTCRSAAGKNYNLLQAIRVGLPRPQGAVEGQKEVLLGVFSTRSASSSRPSEDSALCMFSLEELDHRIYATRDLCYTQYGRPESGVEAAYIEYDVKSNCANLPLNTLEAYPCGSDHTPSPMASRVPVEAEPILESPSARLTAVAVSVRVGHTITFLGDSKGNLHKVFLGPNGEVEEYAVVSIQPSVPISSELILDQSEENLYIMTSTMLEKRPVAECQQHLDCQSCLSTHDPYCGWCVLEGKCVQRVECSRGAQDGQWLWSFDMEQQCLSVQSLQPSNISREEKRSVSLSIPGLPGLEPGESYSCFFEENSSPATVTEAGITCTSPDIDFAAIMLSLRFGDVIVTSREFTFYDCKAVKQLSGSTPCRGCVLSRWGCNWCVHQHMCTHKPTCEEGAPTSTTEATTTPAPTTTTPPTTTLPATTTTPPTTTPEPTMAPTTPPPALEEQSTLAPTDTPTVPILEEATSEEIPFVDETETEAEALTETHYAVVTKGDPEVVTSTQFSQERPPSIMEEVVESDISTITNTPSLPSEVVAQSNGGVVTDMEVLQLPREKVEEVGKEEVPGNETATSFSAATVLSGDGESDHSPPTYPRLLHTDSEMDYQYDSGDEGSSVSWGASACPCVEKVQGSSLLPVRVERKITLLAHNLHLYQDNDLEYECVLVIEGRTVVVEAEVEMNKLFPSVFDITCQTHQVKKKKTKTMQKNVPLYPCVSVTLYNCSVGRSDCSRCHTADQKYSCVWCGGAQSSCVYTESCSERIEETCPAPVIHFIEPQSGLVEGGTVVTISGSNLGQKAQDIQGSVTVAGVPCIVIPDLYEISSRIVCQTEASKEERSGHVSVEVSGGGYGLSAQRFSYQNPVVTEVTPRRGPKAGGTSLTISGRNLLTGRPSEISVLVGTVPCTIVSGIQDGAIMCVTNSTNSTGDHKVTVRYSNVARHLHGKMYRFTPNPNITHAAPSKSFLTYYMERCDVNTSTLLLCRSPSLEPHAQGGRIQVEFLLDNLRFNFNSITHTPFTYERNPTLRPLNHHNPSMPFRYKPGSVISVEGENLDLAIFKEEVVAMIGEGVCSVKTLTRNHLYCEPPAQQPSPGPGKKREGADTLPEFTVQMGNLNFSLGRVQYDTLSQSTFPLEAQIGVGVGASIVALIVLIIVLIYRRKSKQALRDYKKVQIQLENLETSVRDRCKKEFTDLMTEMMDMSSDLVGSGIPFLDYRMYAERIFFPGHRESPLRRDLDVQDCRRATVEQGLVQLSNLLNSKLFLTKFIHTLESQRTFSPRDRAYVASLLTVSLHGKLEYFTDILKTLLNDLVEQYVAKNPKLMLRRTETVVEKLLTNWMSICLYAFLRDSAGESLYMLFRAIKHQVDKGPVDAVTGKAKYTLNDNRLLREDLEYRTLTLNVLMQGVGMNETQPLPSKVLDCDTITQVKEKILDQVYKGTSFSHRPHADSLDLEWRSGVAGHLILSDEDLTSVVQGNWKRLNTLQHYKVPDGATVALVPRHSKHIHHDNHDYVAGEKTPMLEDADEGGVRLWHLVKASEEPELPKHRRGSLRERERAKAIPEIYLTRLLSMKGTLQKFVDDLFQVILSASRPVPLAVKYFFDLLDDQAVHHGISDSETIHIWKTNSLPLRFWINIVKNPQFIFDVQVSDNVDAVLSVIAQTFMDSCTIAEHKLGRDSPINKLLYARDIPRYKQMVERYYSDIRQTISASDQEMNSALAELSRNYSGELNYLVALHELYKYINKYYDQIITALEEDTTAQKMQLGYRLQQIAAAVENKVTDL
uniref:Plexin-B1 n=1 Tax=Denticeps clupeoides TaxID=299321 RepID=A0AAY4E0S8_9TELE